MRWKSSVRRKATSCASACWAIWSVWQRSCGPARRRSSLRPSFEEPPPERPGVDLLLAIPRPKALRKVLPAVASLGVYRVVLVNAARVEKSYVDSSVLRLDSMRELLIVGLEQARDTRLPEVLVRERFRPFVEDELDALWPGTGRLVAHPGADGAT